MGKFTEFTSVLCCMFAFHPTDKDEMHTSVHTTVKLVHIKHKQRGRTGKSLFLSMPLSCSLLSHAHIKCLKWMLADRSKLGWQQSCNTNPVYIIQQELMACNINVLRKTSIIRFL